MSRARAIHELETSGSDLIPSDIIDRLFLSGESPLKIWREFRGLKASELAEMAGESKSYISKLEHSRSQLMRAGAGKVARLAKALEIGTDLLVFSE